MRVVFVTATRADFGKLKPIILALQERMDVRVFVTGMHMLSKYGSTYREVLKAGVTQPYLFSNQRAGDPMDYVLARTIQGLGDYLKENRAEVVVVHGDRVEAMAGALAGALHNILVAHIEGGEVSGTVDEHLRHAVTKLSHLHLVANEEAKRRVVQLGERPEAVHVTGSPDLDVMSSPGLPTLEEAVERYEIPFRDFGICIFHPVTTEVERTGADAEELVAALETSGRNWVVVHPNNDHGCEAILDVYRSREGNGRFRFFPSIRFEYFLTLMKHSRLVVGNSSAGIREAPFYGRHAVNVGTRQRNRTSSPMVANVGADRGEIEALIDERWGKTGEPSSDFGDGRSTERITEIFLSMDGKGTSIQKVFRDISDDRRQTRTDMDDLQEEIEDLTLKVVSTQLDTRYRDNMALFEAVLPEAHEMLREHEAGAMHLHYDEGGFVNLVNSHNGLPVYREDPREYARKQVEGYRSGPRHLIGGNRRTVVLAEEENAHLFNSNQIVDLLLENPQETLTELPEEVTFMLMLGVGLGYQLEYLLETTDLRHLCIVEPELDIFQASLHTLDWRPVVEHFSRPGHSLELVVGRSATECCREVDAYLADIGPFHAVVPFIYEHLKSDKLALTHKDFVERVMPIQFVAQGYFDDEQVGLAHSVENYRRREPVLQDHARRNGRYVNRPAFVVANGPSLDQAVEWLRENQDRGVVVSCGTALGSLVKAGVRPDYHVEVERSRPVVEWITRSTSEADRAEITLLALNTVHPEVFDLFPRRGMVMKSHDAGADYLSRFFSPESGVVSLSECNPTVANSALSLTAAMGFSRVYLFGLDLGFPAGDQHHSTLSAHYEVEEEGEGDDSVFRRPGEDQILHEAGNFGGTVATKEVFRRAKWVAESALRANPKVSCHNTSRGILIHGARPARLEEIHLASGRFDKKKFTEGLFRQYFTTEGLVWPEDDDTSELTDRVMETLAGLEKIARTRVGSRREGLEVLTSFKAFMDSSGEDEARAHAAVLLEGSVKFFSVLLSQALHRFVDEEESVELYRTALERFLDFLRQAEELTRSRLFAVDTRTRHPSERVA